MNLVSQEFFLIVLVNFNRKIVVSWRIKGTGEEAMTLEY